MRVDLPACDGSGEEPPIPGNDPENPTPRPYDGAPIQTAPSEPLAPASGCDFLDRSECLYPFPNDRFTSADAGSETGRRVAFDAAGDAAEHRRHAGRTRPSSTAATASAPAHRSSPRSRASTRPAAFAADGPRARGPTSAATPTPTQPVVVIDTATRRALADLGGARLQPARAHARQHRGRDADRPSGGELHRGPPLRRRAAQPQGRERRGDPRRPTRFRVYRDRLITEQPEVESRRPHMEAIFSDLGSGRHRALATSTSPGTSRSRAEENLSGRMLHIRDDAFAQLGDTNLADGQVQGSSPRASPVCRSPTTRAAEDARIARKVTGNVRCPAT